MKPQIILLLLLGAGAAGYFWWRKRRGAPISNSAAASVPIPESTPKEYTMPDTSYNAVTSIINAATEPASTKVTMPVIPKGQEARAKAISAAPKLQTEWGPWAAQVWTYAHQDNWTYKP